MPVWYLDHVLARVGFTHTYDGQIWKLNLAPAKLTVTVSALNGGQLWVSFNKAAKRSLKQQAFLG